jgi:hypothetical protein
MEPLYPDLSRFRNDKYSHGRSFPVRLLWIFCEALVLKNPLFVWSEGKAILLRLFGAKVGKGVVIKPNLSVKHPWFLTGRKGVDRQLGPGHDRKRLLPVPRSDAPDREPQLFHGDLRFSGPTHRHEARLMGGRTGAGLPWRHAGGLRHFGRRFSGDQGP